MKNIVLIAKREFLTQAKKKTFIILTLLMPLLLIGFGWIIALIFQANKDMHTIMVIDKSRIFKNELKSNESITYVLTNPDTETSLKEFFKDNKETDGILIIPKNENLKYLENNIKLFTNKNIGYDIREEITKSITKIIRDQKIKQLNILPAQIQDLDREIQLKVTNILAKETEDNNLSIIKSGVSMFLIYIIFMFIIMYGVRIMRSVLEEKTIGW